MCFVIGGTRGDRSANLGRFIPGGAGQFVDPATAPFGSAAMELAQLEARIRIRNRQRAIVYNDVSHAFPNQRLETPKPVSVAQGEDFLALIVQRLGGSDPEHQKRQTGHESRWSKPRDAPGALRFAVLAPVPDAVHEPARAQARITQQQGK
jgi:hypothetical protein